MAEAEKRREDRGPAGDRPAGARNGRARRALWISAGSIALLAACRAWLAVALPLTDSTEARYAEMARKMVETGNWLMPQHAYEVPYLAKPPFSFWQSALGIQLLGASELAARLPIMLWSVAFCTVFFVWLRRLFGSRRAWIGTLVLTSTLLFYVSTAAVMTDMILTICVAVALMSFWSRQQGGSGLTEAGMYVALGIGLLTKGPLAAVLVLLPIGAWAWATHRVAEVWRRFAWIRGGLLTGAVAVPWYLAAEWRYPGFLEYFIVGEHLGRFLIPGWSGDLYGFAHELPRGTIWIFYLLALMPWPILLLPLLYKSLGTVGNAWRADKSIIVFAIAWTVTPLALFTFSANIIWPYALPALPGTALLIVALLTSGEPAARRALRLGWLAASIVSVGAVLLGQQTAFIDAHTKKQVIGEIRARHPADDWPIYYWGRQYFSAQFYSRGAARPLDSPADLDELLAADRGFSLIIRGDSLDALPPSARARLETVDATDAMILLEPLDTAVGAAARESMAPLASKARRR